MSGGPLQGIRVLDLTSVVMGPVATQFFADYGADVVKIEPPEGDLLRTLGGKSVTPKMASKFLHMNRNKRSVVLDLKQPAARGALKRLCAGADVLVVNMRAAALKRLGLGYDELRAANGKLVYCSLVGFGQSGRYAAKPAYDTIIQGSAGVAACHARSTGTPRYTPMVMADHIVGLIAVQMVLLALYQRKSSGAGQHIEVPMFENMAAFVMSEHMYLRTFDPPLGATGDPRVLEPEARPLPTADGFICVSANTDKQAFAFFDAVGRPELKADRRFESVAARFENVRDYFEVRAQSLRTDFEIVPDVLEPSGHRFEAPIGLQLGSAHRIEERKGLLVGVGRHADEAVRGRQRARFRLEYARIAGRPERRIKGAQLHVLGHDECRHVLEHGNLDVLPRAAALALIQGEQDHLNRDQPDDVVGHDHRRVARRAR